MSQVCTHYMHSIPNDERVKKLLKSRNEGPKSVFPTGTKVAFKKKDDDDDDDGCPFILMILIFHFGIPLDIVFCQSFLPSRDPYLKWLLLYNSPVHRERVKDHSCRFDCHFALFFFFAGKEKLNYPMDKSVYVVLEEDGTEVDEEEYFQTLPENTLLMLLHVGDKWSPTGHPFQ